AEWVGVGRVGFRGGLGGDGRGTRCSPPPRSARRRGSPGRGGWRRGGARRCWRGGRARRCVRLRGASRHARRVRGPAPRLPTAPDRGASATPGRGPTGRSGGRGARTPRGRSPQRGGGASRPTGRGPERRLVRARRGAGERRLQSPFSSPYYASALLAVFSR